MSQGTPNLSFPLTSGSKSYPIYSPYNSLADEGSLFVITNTPGTAVTQTTSVVDDATGATTHAQQKPSFLLQNQWPAGVNSYNIYLQYLKIICTSVPTSATTWRYAMRLDPLSSKLTSAGTAFTPVNVNSASGITSKAFFNTGTITTTDSTVSPQQRLIANGQVSDIIPIANDEWLFNFGQPSNYDSAGANASVNRRLTVPTVPVVIAPGWFWTLELWGPSNAAAPAYEFELVFAERPQGQ